MKVSKDDLIKGNAELAANNSRLCREDQRLRDEFTKLLNGYKPQHFEYGSRRIATLSWEEIFFGMGELRSDANYSCLLQSRESMRAEIEELKKQLSEVKK
jgi:hypothetical protein